MRHSSRLRATLTMAVGLSLVGVGVPAAVATPAAAVTLPAASAIAETGAEADSDVVVTFESGGGTPVDPQHVHVGDTVQAPERPTKDGSVFVGWYTDEAATVRMWDFLNGTAQDSMTLYATWVQVDETHRLLNAYASAEELESP